MKNQSKTSKIAAGATSPCAAMPVNLGNAGKFIEIDDAVDSLQAYFDVPGTPSPTDPTHIYGHTFGLSKLRSLIINIDAYNAGLTQNDPAIEGVRIYYGIDQRTDPDFPLNPANGSFRDLIFMPVLQDGGDLFPIIGGLVDPGNLILSGSRPCPNECGLSFILK